MHGTRNEFDSKREAETETECAGQRDDVALEAVDDMREEVEAKNAHITGEKEKKEREVPKCTQQTKNHPPRLVVKPKQ